MLSERHRSRIYDYYLRKSGGLKLSEEIRGAQRQKTQLSSEGRDCCGNEAQQPDDKKTELPFATKSNFRFKPSQSPERISGADMNFVE